MNPLGKLDTKLTSKAKTYYKNNPEIYEKYKSLFDINFKSNKEINEALKMLGFDNIDPSNMPLINKNSIIKGSFRYPWTFNTLNNKNIENLSYIILDLYIDAQGYYHTNKSLVSFMNDVLKHDEIYVKSSKNLSVLYVEAMYGLIKNSSMTFNNITNPAKEVSITFKALASVNPSSVASFVLLSISKNVDSRCRVIRDNLYDDLIRANIKPLKMQYACNLMKNKIFIFDIPCIKDDFSDLGTRYTKVYNDKFKGSSNTDDKDTINESKKKIKITSVGNYTEEDINETTTRIKKLLKDKPIDYRMWYRENYYYMSHDYRRQDFAISSSLVSNPFIIGYSTYNNYLEYVYGNDERVHKNTKLRHEIADMCNWVFSEISKYGMAGGSRVKRYPILYVCRKYPNFDILDFSHWADIYGGTGYKKGAITRWVNSWEISSLHPESLEAFYNVVYTLSGVRMDGKIREGILEYMKDNRYPLYVPIFYQIAKEWVNGDISIPSIDKYKEE